MDHKKYSMFIGRFQCLPPHKGHETLIRSVLDEGKNVCIALRESDGTEKNPYTFEERKAAFEHIFAQEIKDGRMIITAIPDISEICYGRDVGYGIRELHLKPELEAISATEMRNKK